MAEGWTHSLLHQDSVIEVTGPESVLGRSRHCQVTIADPSVSRKHVLLKPGPGHIVVRDLGSSNGTFVNDRKVVSEDVVEDGDTLRVGDAILRTRIVGPATPDADPLDIPTPAHTVRIPRPATPDGPTAIPQVGEATSFLQAESMRLAAQVEYGDDSPLGEPRTEDVSLTAAPPAAPSEAALGHQTIAVPTPAQTQRFENVQDLLDPPPASLPPDIPTPAQTQRFENVQDLLDPSPASLPPDIPTPAQTQRLENVQDLLDPPPADRSPENPPSDLPTPAQTQRFESVQALLDPPGSFGGSAELPTAAQTQRIETIQAAPESPSAEAITPPDALSPRLTQPIPTGAGSPPPPAVEPPRPDVQAFDDGPTSLQIPGPPQVPDIDVSSEQSIIGMPAIPLPMPDVDGDAPEVPDIDLASEQSIIGMPAIPLPMPDVDGDAPEVPDIDISSEQSILGMEAIQLPVAGDTPMAYAATPSMSPPPPPEPQAPPSAPAAEAPAYDEPLFESTPDAPSFEPDLAAPSALSFEPEPAESFAPSFEPEPAAESFELDAEPPTTDMPAVRSVSTVPLDDDEDIRSLVKPLSDAPDDFSGFSLDLDASGTGSVVAPAAPSPAAPAEPEPAPVMEPAAAIPVATPEEPRFDIPIPPATPPPIGPDDPPVPDFEPSGFTAEPPASTDFTPPDFEPPSFEPPSFEPPSFEAPDLEPGEFFPSAAPAAFDQPTPAAAPPPAADDLDFPLRQPAADLLPALDDMTASVAPPEARPPEPIYDAATDAFAHTAATPSTALIDTQLAGFWIRSAASSLDLILVASLTAGGLMLTQNQLIGGAIGGVCLLAIYFGWAFAGRSPGKIALGLVIEDVEGEAKLGLLRAAVRAAGCVLSVLSLGFGFLMVLLRDDRRALHDRIAGTWVRRG